MNWYYYYGSSVEREWLQMNMNVSSVQRMRSEIIKSPKHLDCNIYIWTDITIMVLHMNNNNYKWTDIIIMVLPLNNNDYKWSGIWLISSMERTYFQLQLKFNTFSGQTIHITIEPILKETVIGEEK